MNNLTPKTMTTQIFVNMHVKDLTKSTGFFEKLGYKMNPQFSDDKAACVVISESIFAMLHTTPSMDRFIPKGRTIADANKHTEVLLALSTESKELVESTFKKAIAAGGAEARPAEDHGFMYLRSFSDLDGHLWEVFWFNPEALQQ